MLKNLYQFKEYFRYKCETVKRKAAVRILAQNCTDESVTDRVYDTPSTLLFSIVGDIEFSQSGAFDNVTVRNILWCFIVMKGYSLTYILE